MRPAHFFFPPTTISLLYPDWCAALLHPPRPLRFFSLRIRPMPSLALCGSKDLGFLAPLFLFSIFPGNSALSLFPVFFFEFSFCIFFFLFEKKFVVPQPIKKFSIISFFPPPLTPLWPLLDFQPAWLLLFLIESSHLDDAATSRFSLLSDVLILPPRCPSEVFNSFYLPAIAIFSSNHILTRQTFPFSPPSLFFIVLLALSSPYPRRHRLIFENVP